MGVTAWAEAYSELGTVTIGCRSSGWQASTRVPEILAHADTGNFDFVSCVPT